MAQPEFKYVPLTGDGLRHPKEFEKLVRQHETEGYKFVGSVPLATAKRFEPASGEMEDENGPTLVFRKKPVEAAADQAKLDRLTREEVTRRLMKDMELQKESDLMLMQRRQQRAAELEQSRAKADKLRAEIADLEAKVAGEKKKD